MNGDFNKHGRPRFLALLTVAIMSVFVVRLFYLQVIQHDHYVRLANNEQLRQLVIPSQRGEIYALDGDQPVKIVLNQTVYTVFADPKIVDKPQEVIDLVQRTAGGNARPNLDLLLAKKTSRYQILATKVTRGQAEMMKKAGLHGLGFQQESQRVYPEGQLAAQTLGFVDAEGVGRYGVESYFNNRLTGVDGLLQSVTDVRDVPLTIGAKNINQPAKNGDNIVLTIDRNVQAYTEKALAKGLKDSGATNGSAIVINPQTGEILAMANLPTYNPTDYNKVTDAAAFNNATVSIPYEPGSDIKTMTVTAGLDKGVITPETKYNNTDYIKVEDRTITNATKGQTGMITMQHALNYSLNTGMVTIAKLLGDGNSITYGARQTLYDYFHNKFQLGTITGVEVAGEAKGIVIPPTAQDGGAVRYSNMAFGQGMDVTMVQVVAGFSTIINGGTYYKPTVVAGTIDDEGAFAATPLKDATRNVISPETSSAARKMIHDARSAFYASSDRPGFDIGGKTGTSQTIENGQYVDNQTVGTYLGYGGNDTPRYVIMVQVSGKGLNMQGNKHAMPIFNDISNWMIDYLKLQPKG